MEYRNLPPELRTRWDRIEFFQRLVTDPMDLKKMSVTRGDPVLLIGTETYRNPVLCEFLEYIGGFEGKTSFATPFKAVLSSSSKTEAGAEPIVEIETPRDFPRYDRLMPTRADTIAVGMQSIEETLYRIRNYEIYSGAVAGLFERLRTR